MFPGEKSSALAVLSAPEASKFVEDYNKDVAFENKKAFQMDKVLQRYTADEDGMITDALGLISGLQMLGPFRLKVRQSFCHGDVGDAIYIVVTLNSALTFNPRRL